TPLAEPVLPIADRYELPAAGVALDRVGTALTVESPTVVFESAGRFTLVEPGDLAEMPAGGYAVVPLEA
ncbi:MAG: hypothetical protein VW685_07115, partial [Ilumatobacter sp.]